jgi:class 3 adenylate cyclase
VEVEYAVRDEASIAYEVFGNGPIDLVVDSGSRFPIDLIWDLPQLAEFLDALGQVARVIAYDARGCGASDPLPTTDGAAGTESAAADLLAVLDAVGCDRASLFTVHEGTCLVFFAATYPERVRSLIIGNLRSGYPELRGYSMEQRRKMARALTTIRALRSHNPRVAHDPDVQVWWERAHRLAGSPEETGRQLAWAAEIDVEATLASVRAPTLVLHRRDNTVWDVETSRAAAARIPNAQFVAFPGSEVDLFLGDTAPVLAEITQFLRRHEASIGDERPLATVLFTDIAASTEQLAAAGDKAWRHVLDEHDETINRTVAAYAGRVVKTLGDGTLATFDGPARAVRCAATIREALAQHGVIVRAGLHTGEIELRGTDVAGIAVHIASRIAGLAVPKEILVSRTVVDLTSGSGITYDPRGEHQLKGVPGSWPLFTAHAPTPM